MGGRGGEMSDGGESARKWQSKRPRHWGCGAEDAKREGADSRPKTQCTEEDLAQRTAGAEPRTVWVQHDSVMLCGFAAPGSAKWKASEAPRF